MTDTTKLLDEAIEEVLSCSPLDRVDKTILAALRFAKAMHIISADKYSGINVVHKALKEFEEELG